MSMSVCLSARITPKPQSLLNVVCMLFVAMARSSSGIVAKSQREGAILGVFFPSDNAFTA